MASIGERLKAEREQRGASLDMISERTGIAVEYLRALEANDIDALPGRAFGKFYIRAYGDVLGFDPSELIDDYEKEIEREAGGRSRVIRPTAREAVVDDDAADDADPDQPDGAPVEHAESDDELAPTEVDLAPEPSDATEVDVAEETASEHSDEFDPEFDTAPVDEDDEEPSELDAHDDAPSSPDEIEPERPAAETPDAAGGTRAADIAMSMPLARPTAVPDSAPHRAPPPRRGLRSSWIGIAAAAVVLLVTAVALWQAIGIGANDPSPPAESLLRAGGALDVESTLPPLQGGDVEDEGIATEEDRPADGARIDAEPEPERAREAPAPEVEQVVESPSAEYVNRPESTLTVDRFDIGSGISGQWISERRQRFTEGQVAWFATRVRGGEAGTKVRHVWMRKGGVVQEIDLELGGSPWRTWSKKTLWGPGEWSVEARDRDGNLLARETFVCEKQTR